jgi:diguanylate cyclase (GGDEF)-like protein/PAS domain S-box-containing protein
MTNPPPKKNLGENELRPTDSRSGGKVGVPHRATVSRCSAVDRSCAPDSRRSDGQMNIFWRLITAMCVSLVTLWKGVSRAGVEVGMVPQLCRKVILCNQISFSIGVAMTLGSFNDLLLGYWPLALLMAICGSLYFFTIFLNRLGLHDFSRIYLNVLPPLLILALSGMVFLKDASFKLALIPVILVPVLLFGVTEKRKMVVGIMWVVFMFLAIDEISPLIPRLVGTQLPAISISLNILINGLIAFFIFSVSFIYFQRLNLQAEAELSETLSQVHEQKAAIEKQAQKEKTQADLAMVRQLEINELRSNLVKALYETQELLQNKVSEQAAVEAELRLAASVFHNIMDGVVILNQSGTIISTNPAFTRLSGHIASSIRGRNIDIFSAGVDDTKVFSQMFVGLRDVGYWRGELFVRRYNGDEFLAGLNAVAVVDGEGQLDRYVAVFNDITELSRKEKQISYMAFHDTLTGLANRALIMDRLAHSVMLAQREERTFGIMFIDLDRFKAVNDTWGHAFGDGLLKEVAARLQSCVRESDTIARMGGDEFVILFSPSNAPVDYEHIAEKIIMHLSAPWICNEQCVEIGASIGVARFPRDASDPDEIIRSADAAMYAAKSAGRGQYRFA